MDAPSTTLLQKFAQKNRPLRWLAGTLVVLLILTPIGLYTWRYVYNPCELAAVKEASTFLKTQSNFYDRVYQVAATASRTSFDYPVLTMQQILMDTRELPVPACMQAAKNELLDYMATVIHAFRAWGAGESDATIRDLIKQSDVQYASFRAELKKVNQCAPFCLP